MELLTPLICRAIGCRSVFARWWQWPHARVCSWLADRHVGTIDSAQLRMRFPDPYDGMSDDELDRYMAELRPRSAE